MTDIPDSMNNFISNSTQIMYQINNMRITKVFYSPGTIEVSNYQDSIYYRFADDKNIVSNNDKPKCLESADTIIFVAYKGNANFMSVMPNLKEARVVDPESCIYTTQNVCTVDRFYISNIPSNGKYPLFPNIQTVEYNKDINDIGPLRQAFPNAVIRMEPNKEINITKDGRVVRYSRRR